MEHAALHRLKHDERRAMLLAFGREHFAHHRYGALTMQQLADGAGVSKGLLYYYFRDMRGFYLATIATVADDVEALIAFDAGLPLSEALRALLRRLVAYVAANGAIYRALVHGGLGADAEVQALVDRVRTTAGTRLAAALGLDQPTPLMQVAVPGVVSLVEQATAEWVVTGDIAQEELVHWLHTAVLTLIGTLLPH